MQLFRQHVPWHPQLEPPSGMVALITWLVGIVAATAIYLALWVGLSALPESFLLPDWSMISLTCALIAIIPFCTGFLSPSSVAIRVIPLVGQVAGTLIFFSTPWFGGGFSSLVYDSLTPLFVFFIGVPLFLVYLPFAVGRALR